MNARRIRRPRPRRAPRWSCRCAGRCAAFASTTRAEPPGTLFGIVQGGVHADLRCASLAALEEIGFAGLAIGGLAVGESEAERSAVLDGLVPHDAARTSRAT